MLGPAGGAAAGSYTRWHQLTISSAKQHRLHAWRPRENSAGKPALAIASPVFGIGASLATNVAAGWHHGSAGALVAAQPPVPWCRVWRPSSGWSAALVSAAPVLVTAAPSRHLATAPHQAAMTADDAVVSTYLHGRDGDGDAHRSASWQRSSASAAPGSPPWSDHSTESVTQPTNMPVWSSGLGAGLAGDVIDKYLPHDLVRIGLASLEAKGIYYSHNGRQAGRMIQSGDPSAG